MELCREGWEMAKADAWSDLSFLQHLQATVLPEIQTHPRLGHVMAENFKLFEQC